MRSCPRCRREFASLQRTLDALGTLEPDRPVDLAESIIEALRAEKPREVAISRQASDAVGSSVLRVVPDSGQPPVGERVLTCWPREALAAIRWCLARPQLRFTLPITLIAGVVLSMVNMGGMLLHGRIDLVVCAICTVDFLVPFLALNIGLLMLLRLAGRERVGPPRPSVRN